jgi:hypothetical protein
MDSSEIPDPVFREAVAAIDAGDVGALERLLAEHPNLVSDRADCGEGYFHRPYLLWFVAENPIRNGKLPQNIARMTRTILEAADRQGVVGLGDQRDYALELVCSGRIVRECGLQRELIDVLGEAGADLDKAVAPALAHREVAAVERLLERGATLTLPAAVCTGRTADVMRLAQTASPADQQAALACAALYGQAGTLDTLIALGADVNAYAPAGFHPHGTPLHHAVDSGSLDAVKVLVEAGASLEMKDRVYKGTPRDWAEHLGRKDIAAYLGEKEGRG